MLPLLPVVRQTIRSSRLHSLNELCYNDGVNGECRIIGVMETTQLYQNSLSRAYAVFCGDLRLAMYHFARGF